MKKEKKMKKFIPLSVPNLKGNERNYVTDAIEKEWVSTAGSYINKFEEEIAKYLRVDKAVACQSGTAGLHLALLVSGVERDTEVIVPTLTFIAAVNPVKYIGAYPIFVDCNDDLTLDEDKLEMFCERECEFINGILFNKETKRSIRAIVVVHVFGNAANMESIMKIAHKYGLKVIEDATEALGSYYIEGIYKDKFLGTIGDIGVYSFNGNKIITTGGGGMVVAKDLRLLEKIKYLSTQAKDDELSYEHHEIGYNYRMTNLQAAVGVAQLEQLETFIRTKKINYELYKELLQDVEGIEILPFVTNIRSNYWFYSAVITDDRNIKRDNIIKKLAEVNIQTRPIWGLIHQQKPYQSDYAYKIEKAIKYHQKVFNLPCSSNLTQLDVREIVEAIKNIVKG
jgi:perosamine synthetase